jgi:hypothetical protein
VIVSSNTVIGAWKYGIDSALRSNIGLPRLAKLRPILFYSPWDDCLASRQLLMSFALDTVTAADRKEESQAVCLSVCLSAAQWIQRHPSASSQTTL